MRIPIQRKQFRALPDELTGGPDLDPSGDLGRSPAWPGETQRYELAPQLASLRSAPCQDVADHGTGDQGGAQTRDAVSPSDERSATAGKFAIQRIFRPLGVNESLTERLRQCNYTEMKWAGRSASGG